MPNLLRRLLDAPAPPSQKPVGFAVVDLETTGLFPERHDRIVELGVVVLDGSARPLEEWTTLVNPGRDVGPTRIHGITASQVADAPTFADVAGDLAERIGDQVIVGHNVGFDLRFLTAEFSALGSDIGDVDGLCTMSLASRFGAGGRTLQACCEDLGIAEGGVHHALADAHATASLLACCLSRAARARCAVELPDPLPRAALPWVRASGRSLTRDAPPRTPRTTLAALAARLPTSELGCGGDSDAVAAYAELLDRALEDRCLTEEELDGLAATAAALGLGPAAVTRIHHAYFSGLAQLARADGVVTDMERSDLVSIAALLGTPEAVSELGASTGSAALVVDRRTEYRGKRVCFTGASVCSIGGVPLDRATQQQLASAAGLCIEERVTQRLDVLVLADPASRSGKARKADEYGVRKIAERAFWASLDVRVD